MKRILTSLCIGIALIATPVAFNGCGTTGGIPSLSEKNTDQIILRAEQTAEAADSTFNLFVHLERDNEALLKKVNPSIHTWANTVRANGQNWVRTLLSAITAFKNNRTVENQANLNTALSALTDAASKTNLYIAQAKKATL